MTETITIDEKGRMVLPKRVREKAGIKLGSRLIVDVRGPGVVEIRDAAILIERVHRVAAKKLTGWREEEHKEDKLAEDLAVKGN